MHKEVCMERKTSDGKRMNRGKFLGFIGKIGIFSFLSGLPVFGAPRTGARGEESKILPPGLTDTRCTKLTRNPDLKGISLSHGVLTAKLTTRNLENIRDLLTGRFFGKMAHEYFKDGYKPFIKWGLDTDKGDSGCFFQVNNDPLNPPETEKCGPFLAWREDGDKVIVDVAVTGVHPIIAGGPVGPEQGCECYGYECGSECETYCSGPYCSGTYCNPHEGIDLSEVITFKDDRFAAEILEVLETTDAGIVQRELREIIFSDDVLNMGIEHFVYSANKSVKTAIEEVWTDY